MTSTTVDGRTAATTLRRALVGVGSTRPRRRGRTAVDEGAVVAVRIGPGGASAEVRGSQPQPFTVTLTVDSPDVYDLGRIEELLAENPGAAIDLACGRLPVPLLDLLVPTAGVSARFTCSCPDPVEPCSHGVALAMTLARRAMTDPLLIATLRGVDRAALLATGDPIGPPMRRPAPAPPPTPRPRPLDVAARLELGARARDLGDAGLDAITALCVVDDLVSIYEDHLQEYR